MDNKRRIKLIRAAAKELNQDYLTFISDFQDKRRPLIT